MYVAVGGTVVFTYLVSSPNKVAIAGSALLLVDDNGTATTTDDFTPVAVTVTVKVKGKLVTYNAGDANRNGILDGAEVWQFTSAGVIPGIAAAGLHGNIGTVSAVVGGMAYVASDPAWYLGVVAQVQIAKATNAVDPRHPTTLESGADAAHQLVLPLGAALTWTYLVTTPGVVAVRVTSITDDRGTASTADDFHPRYLAGDANGDGLLDPGEVWLYTSAGVISAAVVAGQYANTATVVVTEPRTGAEATATDISHHFGATSAISIRKAVDAADPWHPTVREDANTSGPVLAVGSTVTWTYLVTNTGTTVLDVTGLVDDGGTADGSGAFAVEQECAGAAGDVNGNGMLDPGETWCFTATGTVTASAYRNTATVTADVVGQADQSVTASDVATYTGTVPGIIVRKYLDGVAAQTKDAAVLVAAGSHATFTYRVSVTTAVALADVVLVDDNGTPDDTSDDVTPSYVSGDVNVNGLLDPGEVWIFSAPHLVPVGAYDNVVRARGDMVDSSVRVWGADINYSFGVVTSIIVGKAVNALDPWHPTSIEDADTQPAKELLVGTTAVWTYLVTNTGSLAVMFASLRDDNGTPADTSDDFAPAPVLVTWAGAQYNAGDLDHDGLMDVGETWLFRATTVVGVGAYRNTAAAVVTEPVTHQAATGSDVAGYYGNGFGEGLTPGYWKNHTALWPAQSDGTLIFSPDQLLTSVFTGVPDAMAGQTLLDALSAGGGGVIALFRAAVSALLATTSQYISYPQSSAWVIATVDAALTSGDAARISTLEGLLNGWNNYEADLTPPTVQAPTGMAPPSAVVVQAAATVAAVNAAAAPAGQPDAAAAPAGQPDAGSSVDLTAAPAAAVSPDSPVDPVSGSTGEPSAPTVSEASAPTVAAAFAPTAPDQTPAPLAPGSDPTPPPSTATATISGRSHRRSREPGAPAPR
ncbi:DUF7507 domain-containing protein [Microbacterium elymi]